jgi:hypothetical protein
MRFLETYWLDPPLADEYDSPNKAVKANNCRIITQIHISMHCLQKAIAPNNMLDILECLHF